MDSTPSNEVRTPGILRKALARLNNGFIHLAGVLFAIALIPLLIFGMLEKLGAVSGNALGLGFIALLLIPVAILLVLLGVFHAIRVGPNRA